MDSFPPQFATRHTKYTQGSLLSSILNTGLLFVAFLAAYYAPVVMYGLETAVEDQRVLNLFDGLLAATDAQLAIAQNALAHLLLVGLYFTLLICVADKFSQAIDAKRWMIRTLILILGWTLLVSGTDALFPYSHYTFSFPFLANPTLAKSLATLLVASSALLPVRRLALRPLAISAGVIASVCLVIYAVPTVLGSSAPRGRSIIIIGVDSFSYAAFQRLKPSLPTLSHMLSGGTFYQRAYTPMGRTYPAWMSILSGKSPAEHGAIFNLRDLEHSAQQDLISTELQKDGYRTVFSIDERRFNNMDESFGFNKVIGPEAGALDFVLQQVNDTPLTNLLLQIPFAKRMLPFSYTNTESVANYDADGFVQSTIQAIQGATHLFLAVHFESAHYPFETRHATQQFNTDNEFWNKHAAAMTVVDRQIAQLTANLKQLGYLDNALVIVLSDHGEGLGEAESNFTLAGYSGPQNKQDYGHGGSVLSDHENHIVLGVTEFRDGKPTTKIAANSEQVSLLDIRPLIERYVAGSETQIRPNSECLLVETGERPTAAIDYRSLDPAALAASVASFYEIDAHGRMRLRENRLKELISTKDVGWRCIDHLTFYSDRDKRYFSIGLDSAGLPTREIPPPIDDVHKIERYRERLLATVDQ